MTVSESMLPSRAVALAAGWVLSVAGLCILLIYLEELFMHSNATFLAVGIITAAVFAAAPFLASRRHRSPLVTRLVTWMGAAAFLAVGWFWMWSYVAIGGGA
jgi:hypothetical protein